MDNFLEGQNVPTVYNRQLRINIRCFRFRTDLAIPRGFGHSPNPP